MNNNHFWMVWNLNNRNPSHRHSREDEAFKEAERLARKHPNEEFYVVVAIGCAKKTDVQIVRFDEIPF